MSDRTDLTLWNRAGLTRFQYIDGNAATYLEELREQLVGRFSQWDQLVIDVAEDESILQRNERLLNQYNDERRDIGWELARAFARAGHVLTKHIDAYANEGFLGTATQWESVRRLVEMIDYHPAPPASSSTPLLLKAEAELAGTLEAGFQVKHSPADGGSPVIFETLADLEIDAALNEMRHAGWNRSVDDFHPDAVESGIGSRSAVDIQGIGELINEEPPSWYYRTLLTVLPDSPTVTDIAEIDFTGLGGDTGASSSARMLELRARARLLIDFVWDAEKFEALEDQTLSQIVASEPETLAELTGQSTEAILSLQAGLRSLQIALDEPAFEVIKLGDMTKTTDETTTVASPWILGEDMDVTAGQLALMKHETDDGEEAIVVNVSEVDEASKELQVVNLSALHEWRDWIKGDTALLLGPRKIRVAQLNGPDVVHCEEPHGLDMGDVIVWKDGADWTFAEVRDLDDTALRLDAESLPADETDLYKTVIVQRGTDGMALPLELTFAAEHTATGYETIETEKVADNEGVDRYREPKVSGVDEVFYLPSPAIAVARIGHSPCIGIIFDGGPGDLAGDQWVVVDDGESYRAEKIKQVIEQDDTFAITFHSETAPEKPVAARDVSDIDGIDKKYRKKLKKLKVETIEELRDIQLDADETARMWEFKTKATLLLDLEIDTAAFVGVLNRPLDELIDEAVDHPEELQDILSVAHLTLDAEAISQLTLCDLVSSAAADLERVVQLIGPFQFELRPDGYDRNDTPISGTRIELDGGVPTGLSRGRTILLEREKTERDGYEHPLLATIQSVLPDENEILLDLTLASEDGYTKGNIILRGNVVTAGHGERRPQRVLGSGNAALTNQSFDLPIDKVSFVADSSMSSGVRADLDVEIDGKTWTQVATLNDSEPTDSHYTVRLNENVTLRIQYGDGRRGRRLPTGSNNVRVRFRVGSGLSGNLEAMSLAKPVNPSYLVESVRQPLEATGGNDLESVASLRDNAPASVLTLERAVSLDDFAAMANSQSSVWQAVALERQGGRRGQTLVEVVVVPAGGGSLGDLGGTLEDTLTTHALPGVTVLVSKYKPKYFDLEVTLQVKSDEYDWDDVILNVQTSLFETFSLERRLLGQDLFISEVVLLVESTQGVENSRCVINGNPELRRMPVCRRCVLVLDSIESKVNVQAEEYQL